MELGLDKSWYEKRIAQEGDLEIAAGVPQEARDETQAGAEQPPPPRPPVA